MEKKKNKEVFAFVLCRETTFRLVGMKVGGAPLRIGCDMTCLAAPIGSQPNATSDAKKKNKKKEKRELVSCRVKLQIIRAGSREEEKEFSKIQTVCFRHLYKNIDFYFFLFNIKL